MVADYHMRVKYSCRRVSHVDNILAPKVHLVDTKGILCSLYKHSRKADLLTRDMLYYVWNFERKKNSIRCYKHVIYFMLKGVNKTLHFVMLT